MPRGRPTNASRAATALDRSRSREADVATVANAVKAAPTALHAGIVFVAMAGTFVNIRSHEFATLADAENAIRDMPMEKLIGVWYWPVSFIVGPMQVAMAAGKGPERFRAKLDRLHDFIHNPTAPWLQKEDARFEKSVRKEEGKPDRAVYRVRIEHALAFALFIGLLYFFYPEILKGIGAIVQGIGQIFPG